ncbi:MAG: linear amide C-N hydrolase [Paracraurococcus sp.]
MHRPSRRRLLGSALALAGAALAAPALACTRVLYRGAEEMVITGRSMDWMEDMATDLWAFPAGIARDGAAGPDSPRWTSRHGSVIAAGYNIGTADGMNERGLAANLLYLAESDYGAPVPGKPRLSISLWAQYVLDNFATVAEAVAALRPEPFRIAAPSLPNGKPAALHLSISDATGDSAIFEYIDGKLVIHHGRDVTVMTNSPSYDQQLAVNRYWQEVGGLSFLPGTNRAADRFARAAFLLDAIPKQVAPGYIAGVPGGAFATQALASVLGVVRSVSVPLGITTPERPNISSTIWRTVADQRNLVYAFDSAVRPNVFWVSLPALDLKPGAAVRKLPLAGGESYAGEVSSRFVPAAPFAFLPAEGHKPG